MVSIAPAEKPTMDARYLRVVARGAVLPPAHPGAGGPAWVFVDELMVRAVSDRNPSRR